MIKCITPVKIGEDEERALIHHSDRRPEYREGGPARRVTGLLALFIAAALAGGCSSDADSSARAHADKDRLVVALSSDIRSTQPGVNRDANTDHVMVQIFEGLVASREDGTPGPLLADRIAISDDGRRYVFHLRSGIRFHNGAGMDAADVVWTWRRYLDPATSWLCLSEFDGSKGARIESVRALDPATVEFTLDRPQPLILSIMASSTCGGSPILHRSSVNPDGSWRWPVATGPYRLAAWKHGEYIDLASFPDYRSRAGSSDGFTGGKRALVPRVRWAVVRDGAARLEALIKGQVDIVLEAGLGELRELKRYPELKAISAPSNAFQVILAQSADPLLADRRIRRALALSIDRDAINKLATLGTGVPNASVIPVGSPYHGAVQSTGRERDLAQARRLLAAAGYHGQPITLTTNRRYVSMFNQALLVQSMAREAGINIRLDVSEWASALDRFRKGDYQLMSLTFSGRTDPYFDYALILADGQSGRGKPWRDPAAASLLRRSSFETDPAIRQALFDELHRRMLAETPLVVLYNPSSTINVRSNIHGLKPWSLGSLRLWNVEKR